MDMLPVLMAPAERPLAKRIRANGDIQGFAGATWFVNAEHEVSCLDDLAAVLDEVSREPQLAPVRGQKLPGVPLRHRRLCDRAVHGEAVTYEPAAHRWLGIDVDGVAEPPSLCFAAEPEAGAEYVRDAVLPECFEGAACWWQATASAGIKPGIRVRSWFWLSQPLSDNQAKRLLAGAPVDQSIYTPVALHYTAQPILDKDVRDPVARRQGVLGGCEQVEVPDVPDIPLRPPAPLVTVEDRELSETERAVLVRAMTRSPVAAAIWREGRAYEDRSKRDFAFTASLVRAGCQEPDVLAAALVALSERHSLGSKCHREGYIARTVRAALAGSDDG